MTAYQIGGPTRSCAASGRELEPGERIHSALCDEEGKYVRRDFAHDQWQGPPEHSVAHWVAQVPDGKKPAKPTINDALLSELFDQLAESEEPDRIRFRYVLALLLMRRKKLRFVDLDREGDSEFMLLAKPKGKGTYRVLDPRLGEDELLGVQDEIFRVLGWE